MSKSKLIAQALTYGTPLIEGDTATFVWQGHHAPQLIGDFTDWEEGTPLPFTKSAPTVWICQIKLPSDTYLEYSLVDHNERIADPFNPHTTPDGFGHNNAWFYMPGAAPTPLIQRQPEVPHGKVTRHKLDTKELIFGKTRTIYLYEPPVSEPCPLLVVWDGDDYLKRAFLPNIVDNLIAGGRIRPIALAMVGLSRTARMIEYACSETTIAFLKYGVLPYAQANLNLVDLTRAPGAFGVMGASMGGLMALYTGLRMPQVFGHVLSQSGAFSLFEHDFVIYDLVRADAPKPIKIWMDVGKFEWLLSANVVMRDLLVSKGYRITYREYSGGHNYPSWRDDLWRGLEDLYGIGVL